MFVNKSCPFCKAAKEIEVDTEGFHKWQGGALVQVAFPELSDNDREHLITGICPPCWAKLG